MNDETLVALRNLARARSLCQADADHRDDAKARYEAAERDLAQRQTTLRLAYEDLDEALKADRGLLAEAVLGTSDEPRPTHLNANPSIDMSDAGTFRVGPEHQHQIRVVDDRIVCDCGFSSGRDGTFQNGVEISSRPHEGWDAIRASIGVSDSPLVDAIDAAIASGSKATEIIWPNANVRKAESQTCQVGWPAHDCRKPSGHNGQHTWEVTAEELAEAEQARSSEATADLVAAAKDRAFRSGHKLIDGDPLTGDHHPFIPNLKDGRCARHLGHKFDSTICGKDPNAPVHLLYAGDGNTRVDYTPTPKGSD